MGLNESTGRACRAIEYTAHQARVGPSRLLTRVEGNETIRKHFCYTSLPRTGHDARDCASRSLVPRFRRVYSLIMYNTNVSRRLLAFKIHKKPVRNLASSPSKFSLNTLRFD